jgi:uncharacterized repeat protein (TIGR01451 family)
MVPKAAMLVAALLILFLGSSELATVGWATSTIVSIDPASQDVVLGGTATTDVRVQNVTNLYGFEFQITFDPAVVEAVQVQPGTFLSPDWILSSTIDNANGIIEYALSQRDPSPPQSDSGLGGVLATITWRGKDMGTSPIQFTYVLLSTKEGQEIPASTQDGQITVKAVDLELSKVVDNASPTQGQQVMFTITVNNNGNLDATGVKVKDIQWPGNLSYSSHSGDGTYDSVTLIWDVGNLAVGASATLYITATVDTAGAFENIAEVYACIEPDKDSTPNNWPTFEDDNGAAGGTAGPTLVTLSSFVATSTASPAPPLVWPWLVGMAMLAMGGVLWARRRSNRPGRPRGNAN